MRAIKLTAALLALAAMLPVTNGCGRKGPPAGAPPVNMQRPPASTPAAEAPTDQPQAESEKVECSVCGRGCEMNRAVIARTADKEYHFCCAFCLKKHIQRGKIDPDKDEIIFHDYLTGREVSPAEVYIVRGHDVELNCSRAVLAFGSEDAAEEFVADHGGKIFNWQEYMER